MKSAHFGLFLALLWLPLSEAFEPCCFVMKSAHFEFFSALLWLFPFQKLVFVPVERLVVGLAHTVKQLAGANTRRLGQEPLLMLLTYSCPILFRHHSQFRFQT